MKTIKSKKKTYEKNWKKKIQSQKNTTTTTRQALSISRVRVSTEPTTRGYTPKNPKTEMPKEMVVIKNSTNF